MTYEVRWAGPAARDLSRLPPRIATVILTYVDKRLALRPVQMSKPPSGRHRGLAERALR